MTSASRARVACQWNANPRISTTKPVVAESVTVSAVSEREKFSAAARGWTTASCPSGAASARTVAKACVPSVSVRDQELDTRFVALPVRLLEDSADAARQLRFGQTIVAAKPLGQKVGGE